MTKKNKGHIGSSFEDYLKDQGTLDETTASWTGFSIPRTTGSTGHAHGRRARVPEIDCHVAERVRGRD